MRPPPPAHGNGHGALSCHGALRGSGTLRVPGALSSPGTLRDTSALNGPGALSSAPRPAPSAARTSCPVTLSDPGVRSRSRRSRHILVGAGAGAGAGAVKNGAAPAPKRDTIVAKKYVILTAK